MHRWIIFFIVGGLLLTTALQAAYTGWADVYYYPVKKYLAGAKGYEGADKDKLVTYVNMALGLDPHNPDLLRASARLHDLRTSDYYFWESGVNEEQHYRNALQQFSDAVRLRPVSPWLWSDIALMKAKLAEYDDEMQRSLVHAVELGPWQPLVQIQTTAIGLAVWSRLPPDVQAIVIENTRRGLRRKSSYLLANARKHNKIPILCQYLGTEPQLQAECR